MHTKSVVQICTWSNPVNANFVQAMQPQKPVSRSELKFYAVGKFTLGAFWLFIGSFQ